MKNKDSKVYVLLEDDTEIFGNGAGHVAFRQYLPVKRYLEILKKYSIKSTFFVDVAHILFLKSKINYSDFRLQVLLFEETLRLIHNAGMDIQLHIHSQFSDAVLIDNQIEVTKKWNIGMIDSDKQKKLFNECYDYLHSTLRKIGSNDQVVAYKAGSWGIQPFSSLYDEFVQKNISLLLGPSKELKIKNLNIDYSNMENDVFPYFCDKLDVCKIGNRQDVTVLPLSPTYLRWNDLIRYYLSERLGRKSNKKRSFIDVSSMELQHKKKYRDILSDLNGLNLTLKPLLSHLKINSHPFWLLKKTFDRAYHYVNSQNNSSKVIVIETHTKEFHSSFHEIDRFFKYLSTQYPDLKFITASELNYLIKKSEIEPSIK